MNTGLYLLTLLIIPQHTTSLCCSASAKDSFRNKWIIGKISIWHDLHISARSNQLMMPRACVNSALAWYNVSQLIYSMEFILDSWADSLCGVLQAGVTSGTRRSLLLLSTLGLTRYLLLPNEAISWSLLKEIFKTSDCKIH